MIEHDNWYMTDKHLRTGLKYSFFVRVWYDQVAYSVYKSDGVTVMMVPPLSSSLRGAAVSFIHGMDPQYYSNDFNSKMDGIWCNQFNTRHIYGFSLLVL